MKIVKLKDDREILGEGEQGKITINGKLSLERCRKVLNRNGNNYSDEQILEIRDFLYAMATLDYLFFTEQLPLIEKEEQNQKQNNHEEKSIPLHQGEYRRAS